MNSKHHVSITFAATLTIIFTLLGCGGEPPAEAKNPAALSPEMKAQLAYADAHDGTVDHIIEDCATCQLHMKGKEDISTSIGNYTLHLCAPHCKQMVEEDPEKVLTAFERAKETE